MRVVVDELANTAELYHACVHPAQYQRGETRASVEMFEQEAGHQLEPFQLAACEAVAAGESAIVSAPTSAGKTCVARYALRHHMRMGMVAYTSPIKALSNQKFVEFSEAFPGEVGLLTGDTQIRPDARILVATTEIFRARLGEASFSRDLRAVIFDEIHYLADEERGVAWEEAVLMLPPGVPLVCLSATVPNFRDVAGWICEARCTPVHAIATLSRPVPLRHSVLAGQKVHPLGPAAEGVAAANAALSEQAGRTKESAAMREAASKLQALLAKGSEFRPLIVFSVGRSFCRQLAEMTSGRLRGKLRTSCEHGALRGLCVETL
ncbi:unnamed protein product [Prorocentrum cordatum]|uniref:Helicase ATP-binding domain-containing protein n=1 Tax=Prorocentrum cordatum TaxID=2364126 RepID=A0ABN9PEU1_9DINO|nr:unnamed protein product [Polarella glacialis]